MLAGLQYTVASLSVHSDRFGALVKSEPTLLLRDGRFLREAMPGQRVTEHNMLAAMRNGGVAAAEGVVANSAGD